MCIKYRFLGFVGGLFVVVGEGVIRKGLLEYLIFRVSLKDEGWGVGRGKLGRIVCVKVWVGGGG